MRYVRFCGKFDFGIIHTTHDMFLRVHQYIPMRSQVLPNDADNSDEMQGPNLLENVIWPQLGFDMTEVDTSFWGKPSPNNRIPLKTHLLFRK